MPIWSDDFGYWRYVSVAVTRTFRTSRKDVSVII